MFQRALALLLLSLPVYAHAAPVLRDFELPGQAGRMHYYASDIAEPQDAVLVMHGHPRDANRSFDAGERAVQEAGRAQQTLVLAPIYQVDGTQAAKCRSEGVPAAQAGDALWTCSSWLAGQPSTGDHPIGSFAALDALIAEVHRQWPSLKSLTLVGFSAGAQMLQHSVGFAADAPLPVRYVIADPGSWLYFDPVRPTPVKGWKDCSTRDCDFKLAVPEASACPAYDSWKYGTQALPGHLGRTAAQARGRYAAADVSYLQGELDTGEGKGRYYGILDKGCAASLQGPYRLQRGLAYAAYDRKRLGTQRQVTIVPGCSHDVECVVPSAAARRVLFPE